MCSSVRTFLASLPELLVIRRSSYSRTDTVILSGKDAVFCRNISAGLRTLGRHLAQYSTFTSVTPVLSWRKLLEGFKRERGRRTFEADTREARQAGGPEPARELLAVRMNGLMEICTSTLMSCIYGHLNGRRDEAEWITSRSMTGAQATHGLRWCGDQHRAVATLLHEQQPDVYASAS